MLIKRICGHIAITISAMYIVFFVIDKVNSAMGFIDNDITKLLLLILSLTAIVEGVYDIYLHRQAVKRKNARRKSNKARRSSAQ